ncbi:quinone oxidoreductase family protein [Oenococcus oeni]|uniref:quinone oxidoreductase family protein n=1 Tax=Oenococcus oeni TaxID=1247 RepID=UPI000AC463DC|nr:zinc-binding alcohol dehydrogenase family protein [Oenococcus oeni]
MKALIIDDFSSTPKLVRNYAIPETDPKYSSLIKVLAVPVENIDKLVASGKHYSSKYWHPSFPSVPGASAIGQKVDTDELVYLPAMSMRPLNGSMAEYTVAQPNMLIELPSKINVNTAVASFSSALTSLLPLKYDINIKPEDSIIINGATGFAGKLAIQVARQLSVKNIIAAGRNQTKLEHSLALGANQLLDISQTKINMDHIKITGNLVILDYLWGMPAEKLLKNLIPDSPANHRQTTIIEIGAATGQNDITLPATALRTSGVQLRGMMTTKSLENRKKAAKLLWNWLINEKIHGDISIISPETAAKNWSNTSQNGIRSAIAF